MSRQTILARGRATAEPGFVDTCVIEHPTGTSTDDLTGAVTPTYSAAVYSGRCRLQGPSGAPANIAEVDIGLLNTTLQLPIVGTEGIEVDDRVTITACLNDADLVGRVFYVRSLMPKSEATVRRPFLTGRA